MREERTPSLPLDFTQVLPAGWQAVGTWQEVNIDGDASVEYLLLFTFDQGQVGAAIFDGQIGSEMVGIVNLSVTPEAVPALTVQPVPPQSLGSFRPYRLLPSHWSYTFGGGGVGQSVVALPRDRGNVLAIQVGSGPQEGSAAGDAMGGPISELVIRGGETHLTFVWWRDSLAGYGVTQLAAEGGFRGVDWQTWIQEPVAIDEIAGLYPLTDYRARSLLCREKMYRRAPMQPTEGGAPEQPAIAFTEEDMGITFCVEPMPAHPYFPEGVALAYLHLAGQAESAQRGAMLAPLFTPGVNEVQVAAEAGAGLLAGERVEDIATHPTVPALPSSLQSGTFSPTTVVCVELAQRADPRFRRWVTITLRYQPPDLDSGLPERWTVSGATQVPTPPTALRGPYCDTILGQP